MPSHRTGVLIIRAWVEAGSDEPLRAQVRSVNDIAFDGVRASTIIQTEGVMTLVSAWLQEIVGDRPSS
jgi:hypothetical protein